MSKKISRVGESRLNNQGMAMTITSYNGANDIDIEFDDGIVIHNKSYRNFLLGTIRHPNLGKANKVNREGDTSRAINELNMTIVKYRDAHDIDVEFEDGVIVQHKEYCNFIHGRIKHPYIKTPVKRKVKNRLGETVTNPDGVRYTIIRYGTSNDLDVKSNLGEIRKHLTYEKFQKLSKTRLRKRVNRVGEQSIASNGMQMTVIKYKNYDDIDIQFEDGVIVMHKAYNKFKDGGIRHPSWATKSNKRKLKKNDNIELEQIVQPREAGEQVVNRDGLLLKMVAYRKENDIDIEFPNGNRLYHQNYDKFRAGTITYKNYTSQKVGKTRIVDGVTLTITRYNNSKDLDIALSTGNVIKSTYYRFQNWVLNDTKDDLIPHSKTRNRVGETIRTKEDLTAEIIKYNDFYNIDIRFEDGTIKNKVTYTQFKSGAIRYNKDKYPKIELVSLYKGKKFYLCTCKLCKGKHVIELDELKDFQCSYNSNEQEH